MSRYCAWISFVWCFFLVKGRVLDPRLDPNRIEPRNLWAEQQPESNPRPEAVNVRARRSAPVEREEMLDYLCEVFDAFQGGHAGHRQYFHRAGRLDTLDQHSLRELDISLDQRRFRTRTCCRKVRHHRYRCFDDYRIRRIDDFCGDGYPDIPFPQHTAEWHNNRQTQCCGLLAMDRIRCFQTTLQGAPEGESRQDDLDPADDASHYIEAPQSEMTLQPMSSPDIAVDHPSAYPSVQDDIFVPSSRSTTLRSITETSSTPTTTEDVCCAAGSLIGLKVTSHKLRTCSRKARQARRVFSGQNQEMCETMARTCCLQVALRTDDADDIDGEDEESSAEDRLLASVISATSSTYREDEMDDSEHDGDERSHRQPTARNGEVNEREGSGNSRRRGRTSSQRRHSRHRNDRRGRRRGRQRNRDRS